MAYIDRDLLLKDIEESVVFSVRAGYISPELRGARKIIDRIENAPTADVQYVRHGKWLLIVIQDNYLEPPYCDTIKCSECGETADVSFCDAKYCYMCGAKMGGKE